MMKLLFMMCILSTLFITSLDAVSLEIENKPGYPQLISHLPGAGPLSDNFNMYSGYLKVGKPARNLFYWVNECEDKESKTLVVWFNGGPGCSSLYGLFQEHGPYKIDERSSNLTRNKFSWNRFADTLYIEAPVGTGFSHSKKDIKHPTSDRNTVKHVLDALEDFIQNIQPQYREYDVYLAGESYAGIFIPVMAARIMEQGHELANQFKGIILGNANLNQYLSDKTLVSYAFYHGLLARDHFEFLNNHDCYNETALNSYNAAIQWDCAIFKGIFEYDMFHADWNYYNYADQCFKSIPDIGPWDGRFKLRQHGENGFNDQSEDLQNYQNYYPSSSTAQGSPTESYNGEETSQKWTREQKSCDHSRELENYLSDPEVQRAINAGDRGEWRRCSDEIEKTHKRHYTDMSQRVKKLIRRYNKTVLLYYGDQDLTYNFLGGEEFVRGLGLRRSWKRERFYVYKEDTQSIAGFYEEYEDKLMYAVVKGAGHMAPKDKPEEMFQLVSHWIDRFR